MKPEGTHDPLAESPAFVSIDALVAEYERDPAMKALLDAERVRVLRHRIEQLERELDESKEARDLLKADLVAEERKREQLEQWHEEVRLAMLREERGRLEEKNARMQLERELDESKEYGRRQDVHTRYAQKEATLATQRAKKAETALAEAYERCAKICDERSARWEVDSMSSGKDYAGSCAAAIRALKD